MGGSKGVSLQARQLTKWFDEREKTKSFSKVSKSFCVGRFSGVTCGSGAMLRQHCTTEQASPQKLKKRLTGRVTLIMGNIQYEQKQKRLKPLCFLSIGRNYFLPFFVFFSGSDGASALSGIG